MVLPHGNSIQCTLIPLSVSKSHCFWIVLLEAADILGDIGMTIRSAGRARPIDHITDGSLNIRKVGAFIAFYNCSQYWFLVTDSPQRWSNDWSGKKQNVFFVWLVKMFQWPSGENWVCEVWLSTPFLCPSISVPITFKHDGWEIEMRRFCIKLVKNIQSLGSAFVNAGLLTLCYQF